MFNRWKPNQVVKGNISTQLTFVATSKLLNETYCSLHDCTSQAVCTPEKKKKAYKHHNGKQLIHSEFLLYRSLLNIPCVLWTPKTCSYMTRMFC